MDAPTHCTCQPGRDHDGSEFGPCAYCERVSDAEGAHKALVWDALRWRFTQRPGYGFLKNYEVDEIESNVFAVFLGRQRVGYGRDLQGAVDCALYLTGEHDADALTDALHGFWCRHFRSRWDGKAWVTPPAPRFELSDDGAVCLSDAGVSPSHPQVVEQPREEP